MPKIILYFCVFRIKMLKKMLFFKQWKLLWNELNKKIVQYLKPQRRSLNKGNKILLMKERTHLSH